MNTKRPKNVPDAAIWNEEENEWELGKKNTKGKEIGEWNWWLAPNGHLCCQAFYSDSGKLTALKRFHPNGELASTLHYNEDGEEVKTYFKSTGNTNEAYPESYIKNTWEARTNPQDFFEYDYFDKDGNHLSIVSVVPALKDLKNGPINETAKEAITRLNTVLDLINESEDIEDYEYEEDIYLDEKHRPHCVQEVTIEDLVKYEKELNIKFPPSYKNFVLENGLIVFGEYNDYQRMMFLDYAKLGDHLECDWGLDPKVDLSKEENDRLDKIITFSYGDEGLQTEWFHCFDYNTLNTETQEVEVVDFDQDKSYALVFKTSKICKTKGFDDYMSRVVDIEIKNIMDRIIEQK